MNPASDVLTGAVSRRDTAAPAAAPGPRPLYWSARRELWENRSLYVAPLAVATFTLVALVVHGATMTSHLAGMIGLGAGGAAAAASTYLAPANLMFVSAFLVGVFYSLDALSAERRDRSILFWRSMPVSDLTTVVSKATMPLLVLPLLTFAATSLMLGLILLLSSAALVAGGHPVAPLWAEVQPLRMTLGLLYAIGAAALWHAPLHGLLLLLSGFGRGTAALWALLPPLALGVLEWLTMGSLRIVAFVSYRLMGWQTEAFAGQPRAGLPFDPLMEMAPGRFLSAPGLWLGLAFAVALLAAAARLRRYGHPA